MENTVQQRIMDLCSSMNISITELSKRIDMPQTTVNNYLNGSRKVSYELIESLMNSFELDANWLITGKGEMYKHNEAGRDNVGTGNEIAGDNKGVIGNTGTVGNVGGNHVSVGDSRNIKKIMDEEGVSIEFAQSVDSLQQTNAHLEIRIKDLETTIASQSKTIETMQLLIDTLSKK